MSAEIKAEIKNIRKIFADEDYFYQIPDYQRPYSWDKDNVSELLDDLINAFEQNKDENYFCGSLVLVQNGDRYDVIDGQQRLTTFTILFCVLRDLYMDGFSDKSKDLIGLSIQDKYDDIKRMKFLTSEFSQLEFLAVLEKVDFGEKNKNVNDNNKYLQNAYHFKSFIDTKCKGGIILKDFVEWVFENVAMTTIICPNQDTAIQIFNVLNDRGNAFIFSRYIEIKSNVKNQRQQGEP